MRGMPDYEGCQYNCFTQAMKYSNPNNSSGDIGSGKIHYIQWVGGC